jgi:hypothetical protein
MSANIVKKLCINSSKNYYTGTELSPLHFGLSAEGYDVNSIMEGYDKELWIVDIKNNKKIWVKNEYLSKITHEEPVIKSILSSYKNGENIGEIEELNLKENICKFKTSSISNKLEGSNDNIVNDVKDVKDKDDFEGRNEECCDNYDGDVDDNVKNDKENKKKGNSSDKKPTDYNIFVKFRLNELKEVSKNKKENFENVKVEWRELKKNKGQLKIIMDKAKLWLNEDK